MESVSDTFSYSLLTFSTPFHPAVFTQEKEIARRGRDHITKQSRVRKQGRSVLGVKIWGG